MEELGRKDNGERFELGVTEYNSAVDVGIDDVDGIAAENGEVNSEVPDSHEPVDLHKSSITDLVICINFFFVGTSTTIYQQKRKAK